MSFPTELLGAVSALIAAVMIATTSLLVRIGTDEGRAFDAVIVVLSINLLFLIPISTVVYYPLSGISPYAVAMFMLAGIAGTMIGRSLYFVSVSRIGASRSDAIKASQPLHATIIALLVLRESLTLTHLFGIIAITVGVAIVSLDLKSEQTDGMLRRRLGIYLAFPLGAAFFYGIEPTFVKLGFAEGVPLLIGLTIKTGTAFVGFIAFLYWRDELPQWRHFTRENSYWYLAAGLANTIFLALYYSALGMAPVNVVVPLMQTSPFFVVLISYFALPQLEPITWRLILGTIAVISGAVIVVTFI